MGSLCTFTKDAKKYKQRQDMKWDEKMTENDKVDSIVFTPMLSIYSTMGDVTS